MLLFIGVYHVTLLTRVLNMCIIFCILSLLKNGPKVQTKGTSCCCSRYLWPGPSPGRAIGTGSWHDPVPILQHRHQIVPRTGTKCPRQHRHRLVAPTGAYCAGNSIGSYHDPRLAGAQGKGPGWCHDPVFMHNI